MKKLLKILAVVAFVAYGTAASYPHRVVALTCDQSPVEIQLKDSGEEFCFNMPRLIFLRETCVEQQCCCRDFFSILTCQQLEGEDSRKSFFNNFIRSSVSPQWRFAEGHTPKFLFKKNQISSYLLGSLGGGGFLWDAAVKVLGLKGFKAKINESAVVRGILADFSKSPIVIAIAEQKRGWDTKDIIALMKVLPRDAVVLGVPTGSFSIIKQLLEAFGCKETRREAISRINSQARALFETLDQFPGQGCFSCGSETSKKCGKCGQAYYCGRKCQVSDWKEHKAFCKSQQRRPEEAAARGDEEKE